MSKGRIAEITAYFRSDVKSVWSVVTNNADYKWRSDIERIEIINDKEFNEYLANGNITKFTITEKQEYSEYGFNMENKMFNGIWKGYFYKTGTGGTKIIFREEIFIKNPVVKILSYFLMDIKKIQDTYVRDLKIKLGEI